MPTAPANDQTSMLPSVFPLIRTVLSGRAVADMATRRVSPCSWFASRYRRRHPTCRVTGLPASRKGTAALANSRLAIELVVARFV